MEKYFISEIKPPLNGGDGVGAKPGNANAIRKDGKTRVHLAVRVEQSTLDWLQQQADKEAGGNIGRWLDALAYSHS